MTYYPDDSPAFDMPEFNPEPLDEDVSFPVEPDIAYLHGVRLTRDDEAWVCPHGVVFLGITPNDSALICVNEHGVCEVCDGDGCDAEGSTCESCHGSGVTE